MDREEKTVEENEVEETEMDTKNDSTLENKKQESVVYQLIIFRSKKEIDPTKTAVCVFGHISMIRLYLWVNFHLVHQKTNCVSCLLIMRQVGPYLLVFIFLEVRQIRMMREKETNKFRGMIHVIGFRQVWHSWIFQKVPLGRH